MTDLFQGKDFYADVLDALVWQQFIEMRAMIRKPMTETAKRNMLLKLERWWSDKGHDPNEILLRSIENNWQGVWEPKQEKESRVQQLFDQGWKLNLPGDEKYDDPFFDS